MSSNTSLTLPATAATAPTATMALTGFVIGEVKWGVAVGTMTMTVSATLPPHHGAVARAGSGPFF